MTGESDHSKIRSDPNAVTEKDAAPDDISLIPMGFTQNNKANFLASKQQNSPSMHHAGQDRQRQAQQQRESANLAAWNATMINVGGVQMTNAAAQEARQRFIDNEDFYAQRAAQLGYINPKDKEALKEGMRRKVELEDKAGRGTITEAERKQLQDWDRSQLGQQSDRITADFHQGKGIAANTTIQMSDGAPLSKPERETSISRGEAVFQSAPKIKAEFAEAVIASAPREPISPRPLSPKVSASGLDV